MKYYLLSCLILLASVLVIFFIPSIANTSEKALATTQIEIPTSNAEVAGIQTYVFPPSSKGIDAPQATAKAVLVKDLGSETVLYQKQADLRLPIASTTKIMTALVGSEYFKQNSILTVSASANIGGSTAGLKPGEKLTFRSVLYGLLLNSGNDAAFCIAENYPGGVVAFVGAMNLKAHELGLINTHFVNPAGFDDPNHYSSAKDLSKIAEEAVKNPDLARIVATKQTEISSIDKKETHKLTNVDTLLATLKGLIGVKTGYTDLAKENFVGLVDRDGHRILTVVLGSDDRFGETTRLVDWTYNNFIWQ